MSNYSFIAIDPGGVEQRGSLDVADQGEALRRIREMGLFPTKISAPNRRRVLGALRPAEPADKIRVKRASIRCPPSRVKPAHLTVFTRQVATLLGAGMPLLRSLRILHEQEASKALRAIIGELSSAVESGGSFSEAVAAHPRVFTPLYISLVRAGEIGGALEITLERLADSMEKAQRLKARLKGAMFYPGAVIVVAMGVMALLMVVVVPSFRQVFERLLEGAQLPAFTRFVFNVSDAIVHHLPLVGLVAAASGFMLGFALRTAFGRILFDHLKLRLPVVGSLFRKVAISRFARTLGTLAGNGVPILQALTIVKDTAGNALVARVIAEVHEQVKQGESIAPTLKTSKVFPPMVVGMIDVGEQTGALPELLAKIADTYDNEVEHAASGLTSLLEPVLIVFLAVVVGSIVVAMFLPLISLVNNI